MGTSTTARLLLGTCGLAALACLTAGLLKTVHFERTPAAVAAEQTGHLLVLVACLALLAIAARTGPGWAVVAVAVPAVVCGGLVLLAGDSLLPQLAALPALLVGLAGLVGIVARG